MKLLIEVTDEVHTALKEIAWRKRTSLRRLLPDYLRAMAKQQADLMKLGWPVQPTKPE
jgi:hypothetical protein